MALTRPRAYQIYDIDYKQATRVVTVSNITLGGGAPNAVDGVNLSLNDRILVTGQSTASQNGIYYVTTVGSGSNGTWERSLDTNSTGEILTGTIVMVTEGNIFADTQWKLITDGEITVGVTPQIWTQNYLANSISSGTSNVIVNANANVTISSAGTPNVLTISSTGTVTLGTASITGNVTGGNILTGGLISATGNISGNYLLANIAYATGYTASKIYNGNSEANIGSSNGNANISINGVSNVAVFASDGEYVTGLLSVTGNITGGNVSATNLSGSLTTAVQGNITSVGTLTSLSVSGNVDGGNILTGGLISATGNITGGNISSNGLIKTTGNLDAASMHSTESFVGNVIFGENIYANAQISTFGNVYSNNEVVSGFASVTGNITGGNVLTAGIVSATGNIYTAGIISALGNVLSNNFVTGGFITATGNILSGSQISAVGNITGSYFLGNVACASGIYASRIFNGTSEVNIPADSGNVNVTVAGNANVVVTAISGQYVTGEISATGNISTASDINVTGNVTAGNILGNVNAFSTIIVDGQSNVVAATDNSELTVIAGTGIAVTTDAGNNSVTISSAATDSIFATGGDMGTVTETVTASEDLGLVTDLVTVSYDLGSVIDASGLIYPSQLVLPTYTPGSLPSTTPAGQFIFLSTSSIGAMTAFSDGANWRFTSSGNIVS